jgi:hypothetical protein
LLRGRAPSISSSSPPKRKSSSSESNSIPISAAMRDSGRELAGS